MDKIVVFLIGAVLGGFLFWIFSRRATKQHSDILKNVGMSGRGGGGGGDLIEKQAEKRGQNMEKLIVYLADKSRVSNNDVEKFLGVSDASAERYLQELEKEGILRQVGKKGGWIYYEKIKQF